uniref:helix-turn-helix transcriptional regulator n=3 Tax=Bacillaceae TaxID=186817 RepID=UPI003B585EC0
MKKEISKFVGNKIRYYRKKNGLTQKELGEKVGVKHNTISSYENGTNEPEQNILYTIANVLNVSINDFFPDTFPTTHEENSIVSEPSQTYSIRITEYRYIPAPISAGYPLCIDSIDEDHLESISIPDCIMGKWAGRKDIFMMRINGDSMNRIMPHDSLIAV